MINSLRISCFATLLLTLIVPQALFAEDASVSEEPSNVEDSGVVTDEKVITEDSDVQEDDVSAVELVPPDQPIVVDDAEGVSNEGFGLVRVVDGIEGQTLWRRSDRVRIEAYLPLLPNRLHSTAAYHLMRELLMMEALPPEGDGKENFLLLRVKALAGMGDVDTALKMLDTLPDSLSLESLHEFRLILHMVQADTKRACAIAEEGVVTYGEPFWQQAMVVCHAIRGDKEKAELGLRLMQEQNLYTGEFFESLIARLYDPAVQVKAIPEHLDLYEQAVLLLAGVVDVFEGKAESLPLPVVQRLLAMEGINAAFREQLEASLPAVQVDRKVSENGVQFDSVLVTPHALDVVAVRKAFLTYRLARAMEAPITQADWDKLAKMRVEVAAVEPSPVLLHLLEEAVKDKRVGETALLALMVIGPAPVQQLPGGVIEAVVRSLHQVGFTGYAKYLAQEAIDSVGEGL